MPTKCLPSSFDWLKLSCVSNRFFCVNTGFSCVSLCQEFFLVARVIRTPYMNKVITIENFPNLHNFSYSMNYFY